jgi:hypothetical protein
MRSSKHSQKAGFVIGAENIICERYFQKFTEQVVAKKNTLPFSGALFPPFSGHPAHDFPPLRASATRISSPGQLRDIF